jgi:hypothetical protein
MDDVTLDAMSGGSVIATDEIASKHYQRVKLIHGADGVNAGDVSSANGLPIQVLNIAAGDNNIGNVDIVSSALPTGASTAALQTTGNTALTAIQTAVEIIDNAISGSEMQVDIVSSALPTGAATETTLSSLNGKVTACNTGAVVVSSSALPSGASTAAKQPALGIAGTASADVITVQGITSMTPLLVNGSGVTQPVSGTVAISGTVTVGSHAVTNAGTFLVQENGAALTALQLIDDAIATIGSAITTKGNAIAGTDGTNARIIKTDSSGELQVDVLTLPALAAGTNNIGDVDVLSLPALAAGTNNIGDVDVLSIAAGTNLIGDVALQGRTTGGLSIFRSIDLDESEEEVKGSAGTLYSIDAMNMTASVLYLKIYDNTAAGTTVGTTTPVLTYVLPTNGDTNGCGMVKNIPQGLAFSTGITVAVTTGLADSNTGAPAANAAIVNIGYK